MGARASQSWPLHLWVAGVVAVMDLVVVVLLLTLPAVGAWAGQLGVVVAAGNLALIVALTRRSR